MDSNGFLIGPGIKEIRAIKGVPPTAGHPVVFYFISRADQFERGTQIKGCFLPDLGFLERTREINHNRYS